MQTPKFLEIADILDIHQILIDQFGGMSSVRDEELLESAPSPSKATLSITCITSVADNLSSLTNCFIF